jgi:transcriptional regulator with XRE-family HTH domain
MYIIGERLTECRLKQKISQRELSKKSGISVQTISAIENNRQRIIRFRNLDNLCLHLKCTSDYLTGISDINNYEEYSQLSKLDEIVNINNIRKYPDIFKQLDNTLLTIKESDIQMLIKVMKAFSNE